MTETDTVYVNSTESHPTHYHVDDDCPTFPDDPEQTTVDDLRHSVTGCRNCTDFLRGSQIRARVETDSFSGLDDLRGQSETQ